MLSTLKTIWGFIVSMLGKYTPLKIEGKTLEGIYNYLPIDERLCTSGQPTERQFEIIKSAGYTQVINLAPHQAENSLADEAGLLGQLGLEYTHIPVDFKNPTQADFDAFVAALGEHGATKV